MERRIVVAGIGMVTPLGNDVKTTWNNLIQGKSGITRITRFNPEEHNFPADFSRIAGEVKNLDLGWLDRRINRKMDLFSKYSLAAAKEAINDSDLNLAIEDLSRIGVQIGCGLGGLPVWEEQYKKLLERGPERVSSLFIPKLISSIAAGNISIIFGFKGLNICNVSACASGAHAIGEAFDRIRIGREDIMITGGTEAVLTPLGFAGFDQMRALSRRNDEPEKASRPFDKDRDGFVMAEGAGIVVLEELAHAKKRGAEIYAELTGYGATSDAYHLTEPSQSGAKECMQLALEDAGLEPKKVDYINAHGTSTLLGDVSEAMAIKNLFGEHAYILPISSTKSMTGHLLGGAGGIEAGFTVLAIRDGIIPPTINLENPDSELAGLNFVPNKAQRADIKITLSNSFGFGGTNACLVFKKFD